MKNNNVHTTKSWPVTNDRFVAFIDIMGFKDMVMRTAHKDIYTLMKKIYESKTLNESTVGFANNNKLVRSITYSDCITLYSKDNTKISLEALIDTVSGLTNDLFIEKIPHKGAIAYGHSTFDNVRSIFFGQPLIDAYLLQEELHFYGVILHGSVEEIIGDEIDELAFVEMYECPLKKGKSSHYTVYPMNVDGDSAKYDAYSEEHHLIWSSLDKMKFKTSGQLRQYIDNTYNYFSYIKTITE